MSRELGAPQTILDRRGVPLGIPYPGGTAIADQLFALDYGGAFRAYLLEVDRGTEPIASRAARESLTAKISAYAEITSRNLHREHYGLKSPVAVLFTFFSRVRAQSFMERLSAFPQLSATTLVQVLSSDDPLLLRGTEYVSAPWQRAGDGSMDIFSRPAT